MSHLTLHSSLGARPRAFASRLFARWLQVLFVLMVGWLALAMPAARAETPQTIDMKLLVVTAAGTDPEYGSIKSVLDHMGVPYDVLIASQVPLTASMLSNGQGAGHYQGVLLTSNNLAYFDTTTNSWQSAFTAAQWSLLATYEHDFRVRQATLYTNPAGLPGETYGLVLQGTSDDTQAVNATLTSAGQQVFGYLNSNVVVPIRNAYTYLATPATTTNPQTLLTTSNGYAIASIYSYTDGRQNLTITADGNQYLTHSWLMGYGVVNWVSKGFFLGQRKVYLTAQPDDVLIDDDLWDPATKNDTSGITFRMSGTDYNLLVAWQSGVRGANSNNANLRLEMPFNGVGSTGIYTNDTLTPAISKNSAPLNWISHTYDHENLDNISQADAMTELSKNNQVANNFKLANYFKDSMIEPDISGLNNPNFLAAAAAFGIRYILSDTSQPGWASPTPNTGFYSTYQPSILIIPRYPTNLYYNVSTPDEWVSEYNYFYAPDGITPYWNHALSYQEILDNQSDQMLQYMLRWEVNPLMFHQPNLRAYDGTHSLLGDLIQATLNKYNSYYALPFFSPPQHQIGGIMAQRMGYNASGASGTIVLTTRTPTIRVSTIKAANVPLTGVSYGRNVETYGGQPISTLSLSAGSSVSNISVPNGRW